MNLSLLFHEIFWLNADELHSSCLFQKDQFFSLYLARISGERQKEEPPDGSEKRII